MYSFQGSHKAFTVNLLVIPLVSVKKKFLLNIGIYNKTHIILHHRKL